MTEADVDLEISDDYSTSMKMWTKEELVGGVESAFFQEWSRLYCFAYGKGTVASPLCDWHGKVSSGSLLCQHSGRFFSLANRWQEKCSEITSNDS